MEKQTFTRDDVLNIIDDLLQRPDILIDAVQNENTWYNAEALLEIAENGELSERDQ